MERLECDRMFVAVLETGSFAAAARKLGTSSGQASKLISRLEADLGVQLVKRTTRALAATEVGLAYFERIRPLLDEFDALDAAVRDTSAAPGGRLRLSAPLTFGTRQLAPQLVAFAARFPEIQLDVSFSDRLVNLIDEGFDAALRIGHPADSSLIARKLCDIRFVTAAAPSYLARRGRPDEPAGLAAHDCIIDTNFPDPFAWRFQDVRGGQLSVPVRGRLRFSNADACLIAAESGAGIARLPSFLAGEHFRSGRLTPLFPAMEDVPRALYVLYPAGRHLAAKLRALVDFLAAAYKGGPAWDAGW